MGGAGTSRPTLWLADDVRIDIWSDIVCPFCYLGKRRLEQALAAFEHRDEVEVVWHSFELDRQAPAVATDTLPEHLATKYGMPLAEAQEAQERQARDFAEVGLTFDWQAARRGNTFDAHRVVHLAARHGLGEAAVERLMRAYFTDGEPIGDPDALVRLAGEIGLDAEQTRTMLGSDDLGIDVRTDEALAGQIGITSVPFYVFDQRLGLSGAQPPAVFTQALTQAWETRGESPAYAEGGGCGGDCCGGACGSDRAAPAEDATATV